MKVSIGYGQVDPSAKPDSRPRSDDAQPWVNLDDLRYDDLAVKNVASCEHNQAVLDGAQEHLPDEPWLYPWGFWSAQASGADGVFEDPPVLDVQFSFNHKSPGLTLLFYPHSEDWASEVEATWYNSAGETVHQGVYTIDGVVGHIPEKVSNFRRITLAFRATNVRERYIRLYGINYGEGRAFADEDIDTVSILEEVDPTSNQVTINTLNFRLRTHNPEFSIVSGLGDDMLMQYQQLTIIGDERDFGAFFLQFPWKDVYGDGTVIDFQAVDPIGVMDKYQFWGDVYDNVPLETIVGQLFSICFPTRLIGYRIDTAFAGRSVSGWIPTGTCRQALQLLCFAIGAVADDSRRDYVWIYPPDKEAHHAIPRDNIYLNPEIQPTVYYSGVDLIAHEYVPGDETREAYKGELAAGAHTIRFSEPLYGLQAEGAAIVESSANHAVLQVDVPGTVVVRGSVYTVNKAVFSARDEVLAGEVENTKIYDGCTVLSPADAAALLDGLFDYLRQRAQFNGEVRLGENEPGYVVRVPTLGHPIVGTVEQLDINLRAGKARMKVTGHVDSAGDQPDP